MSDDLPDEAVQRILSGFEAQYREKATNELRAGAIRLEMAAIKVQLRSMNHLSDMEDFAALHVHLGELSRELVRLGA